MNYEQIQTSVEFTSVDNEEKEPQSPSRLRKIGKKVCESFNMSMIYSSGFSMTLYHTTLPTTLEALNMHPSPVYTIGATIGAGIATSIGIDKGIEAWKERNPKKALENQNQPVAQELSDSDTPVV